MDLQNLKHTLHSYTYTTIMIQHFFYHGLSYPPYGTVVRSKRCNKMYCKNRSVFSGPSGSRPPPVRVPVPVTGPWPWSRPEPGWEIPTLVPVGISRRWDEPT